MRPTEQLSELIRKKHRVLVQLRDVGQRQMDLVASGDIAALLELLGAKQQLIAGLQRLEQELAPYYAEDPERRVWPSPQHRAECARQAADCNALLEEIVALEKSGAEKMTVRRNEVAEQLQQAHAATQVRSAYEANRRRAS
ncbi:MAG: flagellar protein FlgN [Planctomycetes bacterium]|nr:flagellar protein FlgN [Planctomycetota bacterium]